MFKSDVHSKPMQRGSFWMSFDNTEALLHIKMYDKYAMDFN